MQTTQSAFAMRGHRLTQCSEIAPLLVFYLCDELDAREKQLVDAHLAALLDLRNGQPAHNNSSVLALPTNPQESS